MRNRLIIACAAALLFSGSANAQSIAELKAQAQETRALLAQGEASGMDATILQTLHEGLEIAEQAIREMEEDASGTSISPGSGASDAVAAGQSYATKPNLAAETCTGFTEANYRTLALSGGNDVQLKTMCGQAFEYYTMYKRAIAQGYSETDADRTYAAHQQAATNANSFYANNRAD
ncbi:hypothetical protein [Sphingomonas sp. SAFR-052]|uniref:hypothetical protein n=1 Tax=Sphingomonas sp. SAFR-052 TaxID=3436867 RepID=UPI003F7EC4BC